VASVTSFQKEAGETEVSLLNFVVSDGATLVATRYVSRDDCAAATMYFAEGAPIHRLVHIKHISRRCCSHAGFEGGMASLSTLGTVEIQQQ